MQTPIPVLLRLPKPAPLSLMSVSVPFCGQLFRARQVPALIGLSLLARERTPLADVLVAVADAGKRLGALRRRARQPTTPCHVVARRLPGGC